MSCGEMATVSIENPQYPSDSRGFKALLDAGVIEPLGELP